MGTPSPGRDDPAAEHYFSADPSAESRPSLVALRARGLDLRLTTDRGVFSPGRIDPGTAFLLERAPTPPPEGRFLDLGCGYGPIALTLALLSPGADVVATDVNERSLGLTRANAEACGAANLTVQAPAEVDGEFDLLWSNPPIRIGKEALHELLVHWLGRLRPDGRAVLVVSRHLGADSLQSWLGGQGHPSQRLASRRGYRLLEVSARTT